MSMETFQTAISFYHESGVFLSDDLMDRLGVNLNDPIRVVLNGIQSYEPCRKLSEIDLKKEAMAILAAFEELVDNHYSFLSLHKVTDKLLWEVTPFFGFNLGDVHPDFNIKQNSLFVWVYKKLEDLLIDLTTLKEEEIRSAEFRESIDNALDFLIQLLSNYYANVECIIGAGSWLSLRVKDVETAFSVSEIEIGAISRIGYEKPLAVNPYILFWLLNDMGFIKRGKVVFNSNKIEVEPMDKDLIKQARKVVVKVFLASEEDFPIGANKDKVGEYLKNRMLEEKVFILPHDLCFPLSCPSIVSSVELKESTPYVESTPYGPIHYGELEIPKFTEETEIDIKFYAFPLFNKRVPVVLDSSSIDISRFPYDVKSPFFMSFLYGRTIIIPKAVIYEVKTRYGTKDKKKILEALIRLRQLKNLSFVKDVIFEGEMAKVPRGFGGKMGKKPLEDLIDSLILNTAIETNGILFTNDRELAEYAFLLGVPTISYMGLEDDVRAVIIQNDLKLTKEECIKKVIEYSTVCRGAPYSKEDIESILQTFINSGEVEVIDGKLHYVGRLKSRKYRFKP